MHDTYRYFYTLSSVNFRSAFTSWSRSSAVEYVKVALVSLEMNRRDAVRTFVHIPTKRYKWEWNISSSYEAYQGDEHHDLIPTKIRRRASFIPIPWLNEYPRHCSVPFRSAQSYADQWADSACEWSWPHRQRCPSIDPRDRAMKRADGRGDTSGLNFVRREVWAMLKSNSRSSAMSSSGI